LLEKLNSLGVFAGENSIRKKKDTCNDTWRAIVIQLPTQHPDTKEPNLYRAEQDDLAQKAAAEQKITRLNNDSSNCI
jgi:hypothetical protein